MEDRKIVRRTYTKDGGKKTNKVLYAIAPKDMYGGECFVADIEQAFLFKDDEWLKCSFGDCTINGNDRYGDFAYKQEILSIKLTIENK